MTWKTYAYASIKKGEDDKFIASEKARFRHKKGLEWRAVPGRDGHHKPVMCLEYREAKK